MGMLLLLLAGCVTQGFARKTSAPAEAPQKKLVRVFTRTEGDVTRFFVENLELAEITMTFNFALTNLKGSVELPLTQTFASQQITEAFVLTPLNPNEPWNYTFTNYHHFGSPAAVHDDAYLYSLPYAPGRAYQVTQGYDGEFSHHGPNQYAIDWKMPTGTPVHAARGGLVIRAKDDSEVGGADRSFDRYNNFILIRHSDGTIGHYCHLQKGGCTVREGDVVQDGQLIAHSGNTGFSSGPHLHFSVFKAQNGKTRESIPVRFHTATASAVTPQRGEKPVAAAPLTKYARATDT
jgi:murein DD-endopeptidase MepM/ murein hydrolase activator NlpD